MKRLQHSDGSWSAVLDEWSAQCHNFGEDFESYMPATLPMLAEQISIAPSGPSTGVYASFDDIGSCRAICLLNGAFIPKFSGRVLRVRHLILSPKYDFEDYSAEDYASLLAAVFEDVLSVSDGEIKCNHVKFHFRSPADVALFRDFAALLNEKEHFSAVKMIGAWLFVSKTLT